MSIPFVAIVVFMAAYLLNLLYISVFYHRALAHNSVQLSEKMKEFVVKTGPWVVGLDALAWTCMHRLHHQHADTKEDPHSPHFMGIFGLLFGQLISYKKIIIALLKKKAVYLKTVDDIDAQVHWLYRNGLWWLPYIAQLIVALIVGVLFQSSWVGVAYFLGIMSHPIQGWLVNALAHSKGYRNFDTADKSVNNLLLGYLVFGEGYQNNHHQYPDSAKFGIRWFEFDCGYWLCLFGESLGVFKVNKVRMVAHDKKNNNKNSCQEVRSNHNKWLDKQCLYSILLFCFIGVLLIGCKQNELTIQASPKVINWSKVDDNIAIKSHHVMGFVVAAQQGDLSFERSGKVTFINVKEGQYIQKGALIAQLNNTDLLLSQHKQQAIVAQAKALQIEADNSFKRSQRLFNERLISPSELDDDKTSHLVANNRSTIALAELKSIENELNKTQLFAPFSGVVAKKYIEQEQGIIFGQPVIKLDNEKALEVEFYLSQRIASRLKLGENIHIKQRVIQHNPRFEFAKITEIAKAETGNAMVLITATFTEHTANLINGDTVQIYFPAKTDTPRTLTQLGKLTLPMSAVNISQEQNYSVYKYDDNSKKLIKIAISNVSFYDDMAVFNGELAIGDVIASSGVSLLRNGQSVLLRHMSQ